MVVETYEILHDSLNFLEKLFLSFFCRRNGLKIVFFEFEEKFVH